MDFIIGDVFDGNTGVHRTNRRLAATSLLYTPMGNIGIGGRFSTNEMVFEDNYAILLPRAVAFSAGLINHFFAGKVDVTRPASGPGWTIRNLSGQPMTGTFALHYEDGAQIRYPVAPAGGLVSTWTGTLAAGESTPALAEPSASSALLVGIFQGTIGAETTLPRVAGKVITYTPPPVPCGSNLKQSGGIAGLDTVVEMGSASGTVQLRFEAYSIKDSLVVTAVNAANTQLATTSGMVSGLHTRTFTFNPATLAMTRARVRIVGSEEGTAWDVAMSCPGRSLSSDDFPPTRTATFQFGGAFAGAGGSCQASFYVDDQYVGVAYVSASGGTTLTKALTKGPGHGAEFRNFSCTANNTNLTLGAQYTDPGGTVRLQNMNQTGIRLFDVR